jgi:hypothetical protein
MGMEKRMCVPCGQVTWHNPSQKKENPPRCVLCANPYGTGPKRERHVEAAKLVKRYK